EEHRLACPRAARDADDFSGQDVEVQLVVHQLLAEPVDDASCAEDRLALGRGPGVHTPIFSNRIEKKASSAITRKIDFTTARVVSRPMLSAEPLTLSPCMQLTIAMRNAKTGALTRPTNRSLRSMTCGRREKYCAGETPSCARAIAAPPASPMRSEK